MEPALKLCNCCNRMTPHTNAIVDGVKYCKTCYKREFKQVACAGCGKTIRTLHGVTPAYCKKCKHADEPCVRCGKVRGVGKILENGIACPSCAVHFREERQCPNCGEMTKYLLREANCGFSEPVCQKCRRIYGYINCPSCHKHRRPAGVDSTGRTVCKTCLETDGKFICPICGKEGVRHSKEKCLDCYWLEHGIVKVEELSRDYARDWTRQLFVKFYHELKRENSEQYACVNLKKYHKFFMKLDGAFVSPAAITPSALSELYGKGRFVVHARVAGFLIAQKVLPENIRELVKQSDIVLRQRNIIKKAEGKWFKPLLEEFYRYLWKKHDTIRNHGWVGAYSRFVPNTITACLSAAYQFLNSLPKGVIGYTGITQKHVDKYLKTTPGTANSLRGFTKFIRYQKRVFQRFNIESSSRNFNMDLIIEHEKYQSLLKTWLNPATDDDLKESVICLLMLIYAQRKSDIVKLKLTDIIKKDGSYGFQFGATEMMLNSRVSDLLDRYLQHRKVINCYDDTHSNPYIFPGNSYKEHMSALSIAYYLKRQNVNQSQLFSTAMWKLFRNGISAPKIVEQATGVADVTAYRYFALGAPRLVDETNKLIDQMEQEHE